MQISFLKDLATPRNPTSRFGFLTYLSVNKRLDNFINHQIIFPSRIEFHDYLEWASAEFASIVDYGVVVNGIQACDDGGAYFKVTGQPVDRHDRNPFDYRARNVVLAMGTERRLPDGAILSDHVWHNSDLLYQLARRSSENLDCIVVVGAGQSAAETAGYIHRRYPAAVVHAVFDRYSYRMMEDSPYANTLFDPDTVDMHHSMSKAMRRRLFEHYKNTNYSAVDAELIEDLYRRSYQETVCGRRRLLISSLSEVIDVREQTKGVSVDIRSLTTSEVHSVDADSLVYATGYRPVDPALLLGDMYEFCPRDEDDCLEVGRDYRILTQSGDRGSSIYLQGAATESTHGISASLLSIAAVRAGEIVQSLAASRSVTNPNQEVASQGVGGV